MNKRMLLLLTLMITANVCKPSQKNTPSGMAVLSGSQALSFIAFQPAGKAYTGTTEDNQKFEFFLPLYTQRPTSGTFSALINSPQGQFHIKYNIENNQIERSEQPLVSQHRYDNTIARVVDGTIQVFVPIEDKDKVK